MPFWGEWQIGYLMQDFTFQCIVAQPTMIIFPYNAPWVIPTSSSFLFMSNCIIVCKSMFHQILSLFAQTDTA